MIVQKKSHNTNKFILAMLVGAMLAVSVSVWATSVGNNISVSGNLDATGTLSITSSTASSTVTHALGIGTSTPSVMFAVGEGGGTSTGHGYFTGGLGVGRATTTAGGIETTGAVLLGAAFNVTGVAQFNGNVTVGDASGDTLTVTSNSITYSNAGTTTIPSASANSWSYATSSANIPVIKFDTSNTRVGISTTTPGATLAVGGDGTAIIMGVATSTLSIQSTGPSSGATARGGCIELESAEGAVFRVYATGTASSANRPLVMEAGSCR